MTRTSFLTLQSFGSSFHSLFLDGSEPYNSKTFDLAHKYIERISADLGGTNLLAPFTNILAKPRDENTILQVFVITDGEIDSKESFFKLCTKSNEGNEMFNKNLYFWNWIISG